MRLLLFFFFLFADNNKLHKDNVSYVNVAQPSTSAAVDENNYVNVKGKPASLPSNKDSLLTPTLKSESSRFAEETPYLDV